MRVKLHAFLAVEDAQQRSLLAHSFRESQHIVGTAATFDQLVSRLPNFRSKILIIEPDLVRERVDELKVLLDSLEVPIQICIWTHGDSSKVLRAFTRWVRGKRVKVYSDAYPYFHALQKAASPPQPNPQHVSVPQRMVESSAEVVTLGALRWVKPRRAFYLNGVPLELTPTRYRILVALLEFHGSVLTRERLTAMVWGFEDASIGRSIDVHILHIRSALGTGPHVPSLVTVHGEGYKLIETNPETG